MKFENIIKEEHKEKETEYVISADGIRMTKKEWLDMVNSER